MNTTTLYFIKRIALLALFATGFMLVPGVGAAAAQKGADKSFAGEVATTEMLSYALNLGSVSDVAVYSENGISGKEGSPNPPMPGNTHPVQTSCRLNPCRRFGCTATG